MEVDLSGFGFTKVSHLGSGHTATAHIVRDTETGRQLVAKCVLLSALTDHNQELAHQEVFLLQSLSHPYIVAYYDSFVLDGTNTLVILMEHCEGGDLHKLIKETAVSGQQFSEDRVMMWLAQVALALRYIHGMKVLHRDLKTSNIFLTKGASQIKLGDFGISRILEGTMDAAGTLVGTPCYMSPEVCRNEPYSWKSDIWSLGCVLYELCMLRHAFESSSLKGLVHKIASNHYEPIPAWYTSELGNLVQKMLTQSAALRPSVEDLLADSYLKSYVGKQTPILSAPLVVCSGTPPGTPPFQSARRGDDTPGTPHFQSVWRGDAPLIAGTPLGTPPRTPSGAAFDGFFTCTDRELAGQIADWRK